jgi:SulP family sulfate permease
VFVHVAAPLASYIPLASLAGVLAIVAWTMGEKHAVATLLRASRGDAVVLTATFLLTIFVGLVEAIVVGFALGSVLFIYRMSQTTAIETHTPFVMPDKPDDANGGRTPYDEAAASDPDVVVYRISGAFFFGATASIGTVLERIADSHHLLVIDFAAVPFLDSTATNAIDGLARKARRRDVKVVLTGTSHQVRSDLFAQGIKPPLVSFERSVEVALSRSRKSLAIEGAATG